jgi:hypothetical protein
MGSDNRFYTFKKALDEDGNGGGLTVAEAERVELRREDLEKPSAVERLESKVTSAAWLTFI